MEELEFRTDEGKLIIELIGRIDSTNAPEIEKSILKAAADNPKAVPCIDAKKLEYISSAGLRVLMRLAKLIHEKLTIRDVSSNVYDILESTGFTEMMNVQKRLREMSVEGCKLIGKGGNGEVYRLNDETIVKVYQGERNTPEKIRQNREVTKDAFLNGIPTTIAFDMVRVGENYGVVFEMVNARSFEQELADHPEKAELYANKIADTLMLLHKTTFEEGALPDSRDVFRKYIRETLDKGYFKQKEADRLFKLIDDIPARNTFIHQDFHPGNLMLQNDEIVLIDVEDSGLGHPILDLSAMYMVYVTAAQRGWTKKHNGIGKKEFGIMWDIIIKKYFNTTDAKEIKEINRILKGYATIRLIHEVATSPRVADYLRKIVISIFKRKLLKMVDTLHPIL